MKIAYILNFFFLISVSLGRYKDRNLEEIMQGSLDYGKYK